MAKKTTETVSKVSNRQKTKERHAIVGKRLQELLDIKGVKKSELSRRLEQRYNDVLQVSNICGYVKGVPISATKIERISDVLDVDAGYLFGKDKFVCDTYSDYCEWAKMFVESDADFNKYDQILKPANCFLMSETDERGVNINYRVGYNKTAKIYSAQEMESFYQRIIQFIRDEFERYVSADFKPTNPNQWASFLKYHPDYLKENPDFLTETEKAEIIGILLKGGDSDK